MELQESLDHTFENDSSILQKAQVISPRLLREKMGREGEGRNWQVSYSYIWK